MKLGISRGNNAVVQSNKAQWIGGYYSKRIMLGGKIREY